MSLCDVMERVNKGMHDSLNHSYCCLFSSILCFLPPSNLHITLQFSYSSPKTPSSHQSTHSHSHTHPLHQTTHLPPNSSPCLTLGQSLQTLLPLLLLTDSAADAKISPTRPRRSSLPSLRSPPPTRLARVSLVPTTRLPQPFNLVRLDTCSTATKFSADEKLIRHHRR